MLKSDSPNFVMLHFMLDFFDISLKYAVKCASKIGARKKRKQERESLWSSGRHCFERFSKNIRFNMFFTQQCFRFQKISTLESAKLIITVINRANLSLYKLSHDQSCRRRYLSTVNRCPKRQIKKINQ